MEDRNKWEMSNIGEVTVSYVFKGSVKDRPIVKSSHDVYNIAMKIMDQGAMGMQEQFLAIYLNRAQRVIGAKVHFIGGIASVVVDIKVIAATAITLMASSVILVHNHPSGNLEPSEQDRRLTIRLKESLKLFDIELLDHMIVTPEMEWLSFVERGLF
jgi:DNA repair protein RadC